MNRTGIRLTGWTRSRELKSLAKPLAFLFALLFSLTVHINASLAAGSDSTLCISVISSAKNSKQIPSHQFQLSHCGICFVSANDMQLGLPPVAVLLLEAPTENVQISQHGDLITVQANTSINIRAPPFSIINKS